MANEMKSLDMDAVRRLYRGCYFPAEQTPHNFAEMTALTEQVDTAVNAFFDMCVSRQKEQLTAILRDMSKLDDLCSEDAFVKGFASAAELFLCRSLTRPGKGMRRKKRCYGKGKWTL